VLKKWRSEPEFHAKVQEHQNHFVFWLAAKQLKAPGSDWASTVLTLANSTVFKSSDGTHFKADSRDSVNRLTLRLLTEALERPTVQPNTRRRLHVAALNRAIDVLQDRSATIRYRQDLRELLATIKNNLTAARAE
jgi:hypothetical protein